MKYWVPFTDDHVGWVVFGRLDCALFAVYKNVRKNQWGWVSIVANN